MTAHVQAALKRKTVTSWGMGVFGAAASAPMVVLAGGIPATYAATGAVGLPLLFVIIGAVVALLAVGYTRMSREVPHAAPYYAILARGLGRRMGVAGGVVALLSYGAIQISLYGLLGATMVGLVGGLAWWAWALIAWLLIGVLGQRTVTLSTAVLSIVLAFSLVVLLLFTTGSLLDPAGGQVSGDGFALSGLTGDVGAAAALTVAALMGFESPASFSEEAREAGGVIRSVFSIIVVLVVVYATVAFAMQVAIGPDDIAATAGQNPDLPFTILEERVGGLMTPVARTALVLAIITSLLAFHTVFARYAFAMAREAVLPTSLAPASGTSVDAPVGGSLLQSAIAGIVIVVSALVGWDPVAGLFTWLSTLGALGLLVLLLGAGAAAMAYVSRTRPVDAASTMVASIAGLIGGAVVLGYVITNLDSLRPGSWSPYLLPVLIVLAALAGVAWAVHLRQTRLEVYEGISRGKPDTFAVPDDLDLTF